MTLLYTQPFQHHIAIHSKFINIIDEQRFWFSNDEQRTTIFIFIRRNFHLNFKRQETTVHKHFLYQCWNIFVYCTRIKVKHLKKYLKRRQTFSFTCNYIKHHTHMIAKHFISATRHIYHHIDIIIRIRSSKLIIKIEIERCHPQFECTQIWNHQPPTIFVNPQNFHHHHIIEFPKPNLKYIKFNAQCDKSHQVLLATKTIKKKIQNYSCT